ncbi:tRNA (N6-isopentenyl adenosine(37)-C2)-methylthiotransferase MiaB [Christensenellaceae bacterium OttesenSCG-928-K19]|nr:tRNA (N6-isopentenyl adenosine(37)-C2)-methylthiotransferase MiaB [Christensenellaceae bacterium OttesenSCG-928-K19]
MKINEKLTALIKEKGLNYHIVTYGCQMNDHESEKLGGILEQVGYVPVNTIAEADLILFNTCCVRDNAEQKVYGNVGALKKRKEENPDLLLVVSGCMTQQAQAANKLAQTFPFVDIILGTHNQYELAELIAERLLDGKTILNVLPEATGVHEDIPVKRQGGPLAFVNIMYGCNNFCSYCIVPYVRGRERSRLPQHIIQEITELVQNGYKEVMLLGQNVNSYHGEGSVSFPQLLQMICEQTKISRIRFMTSHPKDLSDELIAAMAAHPQICKHIHLPVQAGSDSVLYTMNRGYTRGQYLLLIEKLRMAMPDIVITTDIIVGFPGETVHDFEETLSLIREVRFDSAFTFVYSKRSGTKAAKMEGEIPPEEQRDRIVHLIDIQNAITEEKNKAYEGKDECVLVESTSTRDKNHICGRTEGGKMVNFAGDEGLIGSFKTVHISQAKRTTLFGELR